ncbi:MAG: hypothetical protein JETT_3746 [Candidatus Jettenia ecosi]|uniref:Uncharacterized protein n=1 Tax=Candidatus Jettenia ecosi TaxID=2494326 RepID=A0A533Q601_9BACT|nr:MAG: hypothetical protein JETT_3746 [Candidatus Jettenia ecosi]
MGIQSPFLFSYAGWIPDKLVLVKTGRRSGMTGRTIVV